MKRAYLILIIGLTISCSDGYRVGFDSEKYGDAETFAFDMRALLDFYVRAYNKPPESAEDLLIYIDRMDRTSMKIGEEYYVYDYQYRYLSDNKDKLIFVTDTLIKIYYKKIRDKNLVYGVTMPNPCGRSR